MFRAQASSRFALPLLFLVVSLVAGCSNDPARPKGPVADFTWEGGESTPVRIQFHNLSVNADHYQWRFPGGLTAWSSDPTFFFTSHGTNVVTLFAYEEGSTRVDSVTKFITFRPGRCLLDSVIVEQIPFTNAQGKTWDNLSGPDLFFAINLPGNARNSDSYYYAAEDLTADQLPVGWKYRATGLQLVNWHYEYVIELYDKDGSGSFPTYVDKIGSVPFVVNEIIVAGYKRTYSIEADSVKVRIVVTWE